MAESLTDRCRYCLECFPEEVLRANGGFCSPGHADAYHLRERFGVDPADPSGRLSAEPPAGAAEEDPGGDGRCRLCGKPLPFLARLRGGRFCSALHQRKFEEQQAALLLERVREYRRRGGGSRLRSETTKVHVRPNRGKSGPQSAPVPLAHRPRRESPWREQPPWLLRIVAPPAAPVIATPRPIYSPIRTPHSRLPDSRRYTGPGAWFENPALRADPVRCWPGSAEQAQGRRRRRGLQLWPVRRLSENGGRPARDASWQSAVLWVPPRPPLPPPPRFLAPGCAPGLPAPVVPQRTSRAGADALLRRADRNWLAHPLLETRPLQAGAWVAKPAPALLARPGLRLVPPPACGGALQPAPAPPAWCAPGPAQVQMGRAAARGKRNRPQDRFRPLLTLPARASWRRAFEPARQNWKGAGLEAGRLPWPAGALNARAVLFGRRPCALSLALFDEACPSASAVEQSWRRAESVFYLYPCSTTAPLSGLSLLPKARGRAAFLGTAGPAPWPQICVPPAEWSTLQDTRGPMTPPAPGPAESLWGGYAPPWPAARVGWAGRRQAVQSWPGSGGAAGGWRQGGAGASAAGPDACTGMPSGRGHRFVIPPHPVAAWLWMAPPAPVTVFTAAAASWRPAGRDMPLRLPLNGPGARPCAPAPRPADCALWKISRTATGDVFKYTGSRPQLWSIGSESGVEQAGWWLRPPCGAGSQWGWFWPSTPPRTPWAIAPAMCAGAGRPAQYAIPPGPSCLAEPLPSFSTVCAIPLRPRLTLRGTSPAGHRGPYRAPNHWTPAGPCDLAAPLRADPYSGFSARMPHPEAAPGLPGRCGAAMNRPRPPLDRLRLPSLALLMHPPARLRNKPVQQTCASRAPMGAPAQAGIVTTQFTNRRESHVRAGN